MLGGFKHPIWPRQELEPSPTIGWLFPVLILPIGTCVCIFSHGAKTLHFISPTVPKGVLNKASGQQWLLLKMINSDILKT